MNYIKYFYTEPDQGTFMIWLPDIPEDLLNKIKEIEEDVYDELDVIDNQEISFVTKYFLDTNNDLQILEVLKSYGYQDLGFYNNF